MTGGVGTLSYMAPELIDGKYGEVAAGLVPVGRVAVGCCVFEKKQSHPMQKSVAAG
jgi:hypothetical protein